VRPRFSLPTLTVLAAVALTGCGADRPESASEPSPTASPSASPTASPSAGPLTDAVLLTDDDTAFTDGADWFRVATGDADLDGHGDLAHPCLPEGLAGTGASSVVRADFELRTTTDPAAEVSGDRLVELVAAYADEDAASAALARVGELVAGCPERPAALTEHRALQTRDVDVPGAEATILDAHLGPVPVELDPTGDAAYIVETGLLRRGSTLVVLTSVVVGQDYGFTGGTPVERMLPRAAHRL